MRSADQLVRRASQCQDSSSQAVSRILCRDRYAKHTEEQELFVSQVQEFIKALGKMERDAVGPN